MSRNSGVESLLGWLRANPRLPEPGRSMAELVEGLSVQVVNAIPEDSPELTAGLRKLLEAKDCFVRAALGKPGG